MNSLGTYMIVAAALFSLGLLGVLQRRNLIGMLISIELMLNGANLNFMAFNRYLFPHKLDGMFFSLFIIAVAAAEAAVAIAIIINIYRRFSNINVENVDNMKY